MLLVSPSRWWVLWIESALFFVYGLAVFIAGVSPWSLEGPLFAILALAFGLIACIAAAREKRHLVSWWLNAIVGGCNLALGLFALLYPALHQDFSPGFLTVLIGIQGLLLGALSIAISLDMRHELRFRGFFVLYAVCTIAISVVILANPFTDAFVTYVLTGVYGFVAGLSLLPGALKVRQYR